MFKKNKTNILKVFGALLFAGFSFFYTSKITNLIIDNDPIMEQIKKVEKEMQVSKIDPIIYNDEYITGINGCKVNEEESYNKMKSEGSFKEELLVMKQDEIEEVNKYIIGGNNINRSVSIIILDIPNENIDNFIKDKKVVLNAFIDSNYINNNIEELKKIKNVDIFNFGRNRKYTGRYIVYDNSIISSYLGNDSKYCLVLEKDDNILNICKKYDMKTIKVNKINENIFSYIKENLKEGKIFLIEKYNSNELKVIINYILSRGYNIVSLNDLLSEINKCS